ncbi:MAG: winged helix-turn-helix domain-containing protein [Planctomycetes bacterium]|nr:winged helix-turn-helix domain-containing protein [Planctomycetota bacterium]
MTTEIGQAAGTVWTLLKEKGPMATDRIRTATKLPSAKLNMALGWLAREGKVELAAKGRSEFTVKLND